MPTQTYVDYTTLVQTIVNFAVTVEPETQEILSRRFGFETGNSKGEEQLALEFNLPVDNIHRTIDQSLAKLQIPVRKVKSRPKAKASTPTGEKHYDMPGKRVIAKSSQDSRLVGSQRVAKKRTDEVDYDYALPSRKKRRKK